MLDGHARHFARMRFILFLGSAALIGACAAADASTPSPDSQDSTKDVATVDAVSEDATTKDAPTYTPFDARSEEATTQDAGAKPDALIGCDAGCRLFSSSCNGCVCLSLPMAKRNPSCDGGMVACLVDPCEGKTAACTSDGCVVQ